MIKRHHLNNLGIAGKWLVIYRNKLRALVVEKTKEEVELLKGRLLGMHGLVNLYVSCCDFYC